MLVIVTLIIVKQAPDAPMGTPKPPWKKPSPKGDGTPLTENQKAAAKARADAAGRRYPNLVDNMWAAKQPK